MITLALGQILWGLAYRWIGLTGGDNGINVRDPPGAVRLRAGDRDRLLLLHACRLPRAVAAMAVFVRSPFGAEPAAARATSRAA